MSTHERTPRDILTADGVLDSLRRLDTENAAAVTVLIPATPEFLWHANTDLRRVVISMRSKIARMGYEFEYGPHTLECDTASNTMAVHGVLRPLVRNFPTYKYPIERVFMPGQRFARGFYEDPQRQAHAAEIHAGVQTGDFIFPINTEVRSDGGVLIPIDHIRFAWKKGNRNIRALMARALSDQIAREQVTNGAILRPVHDPEFALRKKRAFITQARFGVRQHFGVIQKTNGVNQKVHFEARLIDPGSGMSDVVGGECGAVKLELFNADTKPLQPSNVLVYFYHPYRTR